MFYIIYYILFICFLFSSDYSYNQKSINNLKNKSSNGINNNKKTLADEATNLCHGKNLADSFIIKKNILYMSIL